METLIFLCNIKNSKLPRLIKLEIEKGKPYQISWSCWNSRFIQVGDRAYLQRSGNTGNEPRGFIAAGYVKAAPEDEQLRLLNTSQYSDLSAAYVDDYDGRFYVHIEIDSVVDFNFPLEQKHLERLSQFQGVNFNFGRGGARFNSKAAPFLNSAWEEHSLKQQRLGQGRRLVDVFVEKGDAFKQKKDYEAAIETYKLALKIDLKCAKAVNQIKSCELILKRLTDTKPIIKPLPDESKLIAEREKLDKEKFLTFKSDADACEKITVSIARRQGQQKFRQSLLNAYSGKCAITNFDAEAALEAAHIIPYIETENNEPSNGLLLRADLHTLFDLNLVAINPETMNVHIHPTLQKTEYRTLEGKELRVPQDEMCRPKKQFLKQRFEQCEWCKNL
ncbi:HNH endonuclease [Nostoc sp. FACHB-110]|uniref:HNH endonuclease n=1 Tax=Nostoc sp. FACHB-110 TaxID=2692834 RepID=UPI001685A326|nr:HNH endonuclease [Nostoc sp. FACHB-110]MBD2438484.1 HNH endonuclease [Nostoc sp. FACHB-110]